ncbi:hypothetical protein ABLE68_11175 [Nocardioides sp. CN2-186]|uniref:hypothetical protein n=1 Tax=Nocardioides tweenelious TaxID=3156607 RepID=UPI0032B40BA9
MTSTGMSYVGFASGGKLVRISASGAKKAPVSLDTDEPVDGIFVTGDDHVLVDHETGVSVLSKRGKVVDSFDHDPQISCDSGLPASKYGGITFGGGKIWVADRCVGTMSVYSRGGGLVATVDLPGGHARGITYGDAQGGHPATVYVAMIDDGKVLAYRAKGIKNSSRPARVVAIKRPYGGQRPKPAGLAIDRYGQLTVTDIANNAVYLLDTNNDYSVYRTLGHPPRASRQAGRLNTPTAVAQHDQDGGSLSGNLFIADTNNGRVQRWDTGGYTHWAKNVGGSGGGGGGDCKGDDWNCGGGKGGGGSGGGSGGGGGGGGSGGGSGGGGGGECGEFVTCGTAPSNVLPPSISGTPTVGQSLTCGRGMWSGSGITYTYQWNRAGAPIASATAETYVLVAADSGAQVTCAVTATTTAGKATATSTAVTVTGSGGGGGGGGSGAPVNTVAPAITGGSAVGSVLTCGTGTWTGSAPTYSYAWKRNGTAIATATTATYTVVAADNATTLTCTVTATNSSGNASATSAGVTIGSGGGGGGGGGSAPTNAVPPAISGTASPGQALSCSSGSWSGSGISYGYVWKRNGTTIPGATANTYVPTSGDVGAAITCAVTAISAGGSTTATSAPVTINPGSGGGSGPVNTAAPVITGTVAIGQTLSCSQGSWTGLGIGYSYSWQRNNTPIAGAGGNTYLVVSSDTGSSLTCAVTATFAAGGSTVAVSAAVTVGGPSGHAPQNTALPAVSGSPVVGQQLTCSTGSWSGEPTITYGYVWRRSGTVIGGATASTYTVSATDVGTSLVCTVVATNGYGNGTASSTAVTGAASNGGPLNTALPTLSGTAVVGTSLSCSQGTWTGSGNTYTYSWRRNGTTIDGATGASYAVVATDVGTAVACTVTATNSIGTSSATSASATPTAGAGGNPCGAEVGVVINNDADVTTSPSVQLTIRAPAGATTVDISNDAGFGVKETRTLSAGCTYAWQARSIVGVSLPSTVYVRFNGGGATYDDTIIVDQRA